MDARKQYSCVSCWLKENYLVDIMLNKTKQGKVGGVEK